MAAHFGKLLGLLLKSPLKEKPRNDVPDTDSERNKRNYKRYGEPTAQPT